MERKPEGQEERREYANRYEDFAQHVRDRVERDIGERMRDRADRAWERRRHHSCSGNPAGGILIGAIIILVGVAMLLDNLGIIQVRDYWRFWPVIFVVVGAMKLIDSQGRGGGFVLGLVLVAVGTIWTLDNIGIIIFDPRLIWPLVLIGIGALFLMRSLERRALGPRPQPGGPELETQISSADSIQQWTVFGGSKRVIDSQNFRGGQIFALFGGVELDLRDAAIVNSAVMDASAVFGGIDIRVPPTWTVDVRGSGVFGGYEDKTSHPRVERPGESPKLVVTGAAVFGGISIKN
jgi:predicted membrane protein